MNKKGVSIVFNWIFVGVVGALLLVFLISFALNLKATSEEISYSILGMKLRDMFISLSSGEEAVVLKDMPINYNDRVIFDGDHIKLYKKNTNLAKTKVEEFIFSGELKKGQFYVWSKPWEMPFKVSNFLIINSGNGYSFSNEPRFFDLPSEFDVGSGKKVSFVQSSVFKCRESSSNDIEIIYEKEYGVVCYYKDNTLVKEVNFLGEAMMYGAIFANDAEAYEKNYKRAMKRLKFLAMVYREKSRNSLLFAEMDRFVNDLSSNDLRKIYEDVESIRAKNSKIVVEGDYVY